MISKSVAARNHSRSFATGVDYITEHAHERACRQAGRSFGDGIGYASAPKKAAWVQLRGVTSVGTAALEMEAVAVLSRRCKDPVYHLIVAYAKGERPTREQVVSDAERLLKAIGMERNQYVLAAHQDTNNYHAHVIAIASDQTARRMSCGKSGSNANAPVPRSRQSVVGRSSWAGTTAISCSACATCTHRRRIRSGA